MSASADELISTLFSCQHRHSYAYTDVTSLPKQPDDDVAHERPLPLDRTKDHLRVQFILAPLQCTRAA